MSMKVTEEEIGKMEGEGRRKDYTHITWADKVEPLWKQLDDKNGLLIPEVRANLPQSLIDCLPDVPDINKDFKVFLQAVCDAPIEKVVRRTEELKRIYELEQQVSSLLQLWTPSSPMSKMTQKFSSTSLNAPTYSHNSYTRPTLVTPQTQTTIPSNAPPQPTNSSTPYVPPFRRQTPPHTPNPVRQQPTPVNFNSNPFDDNTTPRPNNSFLQRLQEQQTSPLARKGSNYSVAQSAHRNSRLYPDDETGHAQYARDIAAWEAIFGKDGQMMFTKDPLPLTPGSSALGTQECYQCGKATTPAHIAADCTSPIRIPQRESSWRSYINKILFPIGQRGNTPRAPYQQCDHALVAPIYATEGEYVEYDPYLYPIDNVTFRDEPHSGNGLESHK